MNLIDLRKRLERIEASRRTTAPTAVLSDRPMDHEDIAALTDWQAMVAQGRATLSGGVLCLTGPEMTEAEWTARHVTAH